MRFALDASKIDSPDGIGVFTRELIRGFGRMAEHEFELFDLLGFVDSAARARWSQALPSSFSWREGRPRGVDAFLATTWRVPPSLGLPTVFTIFDLTFLTLPTCHTAGNRIHCLEGCLEALRSQARLIAISEQSARDFERFFGRARPAIEICHLAPSLAATRPSRDQARQRVSERFGLTHAFILNVGTLEPRKNLERLIAAHARLTPQLRERFPLILVGGRGWHSAALEATIAAAGSTVRHLGKVDDDDLIALYAAAELFAYPSLAEGFGLPVLEALSVGTPALVAEIPVMVEIAGGAVRRVDPLSVDALCQGLEDLLLDPEERDKLSRRGLELVKRYSWQKTARQVQDVLVAAAKD